MEYAYMLGGGAPLHMNFQVATTLANAGIVVLEPAAGGGTPGVAISTTQDFRNAVGVTLDTATFVSAQQTDGTSAEREVKITISPQAVYRSLMSGGAAENTAMILYTVSTVSTTGLDIITGDNFTFADEGVIWGYSGANVGQKRKITVGDATDASVSVPFDNDTVVGDEFMAAPFWFLGDGITLQTTTNLFQVDATVTNANNGAAKIIDMELGDISNDGRNGSFALFILDDHALRETT